MVRVGEDVSERLDIVPTEIIDGGIPSAGLIAHTLIGRFADHLPFHLCCRISGYHRADLQPNLGQIQSAVRQ